MIYNALLLIGTLLTLPKWIFKAKYKGTVRQRLGLKMPKPPKAKQVIWIHMVSVGETRAMLPVFQKLRSVYPEAEFYFSSTTKTGHQEAKRSLSGGVDYFFLPIDLSWIMRRLVRLLRPNVLFLSESDFWFNLMKEIKRQKGKVILLNGKISDKSTRRFSKIPSKSLFSKIDHYLVQNSTYASRFKSLGVPESRLTVTGNLKLSIPSQLLTISQKKAFCARFGLELGQPLITIASIHEGEEEMIVPRIPRSFKTLLAARHPEIFDRLKARYFNDPRIIVIDEMGILSSCFQVSEVAIMGGSFISGIGGHNIFEPIQVGTPVIFGPFMEAQPDLVEMVLKGRAGIQTEVETLDRSIGKAVKLKENAIRLAREGSWVLEKTVNALDLNHLLV